MMDFVPFMVVATVVVLLVAAWGYLRAERNTTGPDDYWDPAPDAEAMFHDCLNAKGVSIPELRVYRERSGGLVIVGPDDLDSRRRRALSDCDRELGPLLAEGTSPR